MNEILKAFCLGWFQVLSIVTLQFLSDCMGWLCSDEMIDFTLTTRIQGETMEGLLVVEVIQMEDDRLILEGP